MKSSIIIGIALTLFNWFIFIWILVQFEKNDDALKKTNDKIKKIEYELEKQEINLDILQNEIKIFNYSVGEKNVS